MSTDKTSPTKTFYLTTPNWDLSQLAVEENVEISICDLSALSLAEGDVGIFSDSPVDLMSASRNLHTVLNRNNEGEWRDLCDSLQRCSRQVTALQLPALNRESLFRANIVMQYCRNVQTLNLSQSAFFLTMGSELLPSLRQALIPCSQRLNTLILRHNQLGYYNDQIWDPVLHILSELKNLQALDLTGNDLSALSVSTWEKIGAALEGLKLQMLDISHNNLGEINTIKWAGFMTFVKACPFLTEIKGMDAFPPAKKLALLEILGHHQSQQHSDPAEASTSREVNVLSDFHRHRTANESRESAENSRRQEAGLRVD